MSPDAACLKSSPLSAPGCPGVQTHCVHHPILVRFSVLSGVMEWLCVLVSVLVCISCPLHPDQCPMPSWRVPLCPPLHSNAMHPILFPVHTYTNHFNYDSSSCQAHWYIESQNPPVNSVHTQHTPGQEKKHPNNFKSLYLEAAQCRVSLEQRPVSLLNALFCSPLEREGGGRALPRFLLRRMATSRGDPVPILRRTFFTIVVPSLMKADQV